MGKGRKKERGAEDEPEKPVERVRSRIHCRGEEGRTGHRYQDWNIEIFQPEIGADQFYERDAGLPED